MVFVLPVLDAVRIRMGETGDKAVEIQSTVK
jgi:nitrogen regulatory protein PII